MKQIAILLAVICVLCAAPALAQGPFTDVPTDHWAYDAINTLQKDGILIGYPDGTFAGKRTITRYEFAVAIARILPLIPAVPAVPTAGITSLILMTLSRTTSRRAIFRTCPRLPPRQMLTQFANWWTSSKTNWRRWAWTSTLSRRKSLPSTVA